MTLGELKELLESTGMPVTYRAWPEKAAPPLPYIVWLTPYTNNFAADGRAYLVAHHVQIELYTKLKDPEAEGKVELALSSLFWEKTETYIDTERCYLIMYEIEV